MCRFDALTRRMSFRAVVPGICVQSWFRSRSSSFPPPAPSPWPVHPAATAMTSTTAVNRCRVPLPRSTVPPTLLFETKSTSRSQAQFITHEVRRPCGACPSSCGGAGPDRCGRLQHRSKRASSTQGETQIGQALVRPPFPADLDEGGATQTARWRSCPASPCTAWTWASGWPGNGSPRCGRPWRRGSASAWRPSAHPARRRPGPGGAGHARRTAPGACERLREGCCGPLGRRPGPDVPRGHVEALPDGSEVKLGVFLSNTKSRRAKLTVDKLAVLADLGLKWTAS